MGDELVAQGIDNGASKSFMIPKVDHNIRSNVFFYSDDVGSKSARATLEQKLEQSGGIRGIRLLDFQTQAIVNTVYRPGTIEIDKTVARKGVRRGVQDYKINAKVVFGDSDIGATVVNDLMAGSGKSIIAMVSALYFTTHRSHEVVAREQILLREQRPMNWASRIGTYDSPRSYTKAVIVMASDKVVAQWEKTIEQACGILGIREVNICRNPNKREASELDTDFNNNNNSPASSTSVYLFTSVLNLKTCFPEDDGFVPCVIVDEYVAKSSHNIVTRKSQDTPIYGRLMLLSADAGNTSEILLGSRKSSLMRSIVYNGDTSGDTASLKSDVRLSTQLLACAVLPSNERSLAHEQLIQGYNQYSVEKYIIDFDTPIWGNQQSTEGYTTGEIPAQLKELGVKGLSSVKTMDDLLAKVDDALTESSGGNPTPFGRISYPTLKRLDKSTRKQLRQDCPVCFDPLKTKEQVALLCPCWHIFCKPCMKQCLVARETCPMCRETITGIMETRVKDKEVSDDCEDCKDCENCKDFEDFFREYLPSKPVALEACLAILHASAAALLAGCHNSPKRILIVGPSTGFGLALWKTLEKEYRDVVSILQLKVEGNKRKRTAMGYEEQLAWFKDNEQELGKTGESGESGKRFTKIKVLCTHENVHFAEDIVGLDLHEVDSICHVGGEITARRLGRVGRIQRVIEGARKAENKVVRLFNLVPSRED